MQATTNFARQVSRALDDEHRVTLELLARVEQVFRRAGATDPVLAMTFGRQLAYELARHFEFEESEIFARLEETGAGDLAALLTEEHATIRRAADELLPLASAAASLDAAGWADFRRCALEMVERLRAHIDKETAALLPAIDDALDENTDRELAFAYAAI